MRPIATEGIAWSFVTPVTKRLNRWRCLLEYRLRCPKEPCVRRGPYLPMGRDSSPHLIRCGLSSKFFDHLLLIGRIAAIAMHTHSRSSVVGLSVCRSVCLWWSLSWALRKLLNRSTSAAYEMTFVGLSRMAGVKILQEEGQFWGLLSIQLNCCFCFSKPHTWIDF